MARTFLTREDMRNLPMGGTLKLDRDRAITPTGLDEATSRGIQVLGEDGGAMNRVEGSAVPASQSGMTLPGSQLGALGALGIPPAARGQAGGLVIVSALGKNRPRVLAELTAAVADCGGDIQDITQRVLQGYFNLMMLVDMGRAACSFADFKGRLESLSREGDYKVMVQHEDVFQAMHRV